jgi:molecular chaperone Hsp33
MTDDVSDAAHDDTSGSAPSSNPQRDRVVRALTEDDTFRVMVAVTTATVTGAIAAQRARGRTARRFAELLTGAVLVRETMAPQYRVQGVMKGAGGKGTLVADAHPDGLTRGLVQLPQGTEDFELGPGSSLLMMRGGARQVYRSVTEPPDGGTVSDALTGYLHASEQIISVTAIGTHGEGDGVEHCGGYIVQLLPGAARGPLMVMTERLASMPPVGELLANANGDADVLLAELLHLMPHTKLGDSDVRHGCLCDERAVLASLATLPREDLLELMKGDEVLELSCDYCTTAYSIPVTRLAGLVDAS